MFKKRPRTSRTLLACTGVNTRWPVSAELMAICAVSWSRISPTMIFSGSWPRRERSPRREVGPFFSVAGSVVGQGAVGGFQVACVLDARKNRRVPVLRNGRHGVVQDAVDAVLDGYFLVARFDVDVTGAALEGVEDRGIDQFDDGRDVAVG